MAVIVNDYITFKVSMNVYDIVTENVDKDGYVDDPDAFFMEVIDNWNKGTGELMGVGIGTGYYDEKVKCEPWEDEDE